MLLDRELRVLLDRAVEGDDRALLSDAFTRLVNADRETAGIIITPTGATRPVLSPEIWVLFAESAAKVYEFIFIFTDHCSWPITKS